VPDLVGYRHAVTWYGLVLLWDISVSRFSAFVMGWPWAPLTAVWALGVMGATALRIGAFNVQSFGDNKVSDPDCGSVIAQVRPSGVGMGWEQWRVSEGGLGKWGADGNQELGSGQLG
jgi:hypothetical protein